MNLIASPQFYVLFLKLDITIILRKIKKKKKETGLFKNIFKFQLSFLKFSSI